MRQYLLASLVALAPFNALASPEEDLRSLGEYALDQIMCGIDHPVSEIVRPKADSVKAGYGFTESAPYVDAIRMETIRLHRELAEDDEFELENYCEYRGDMRDSEVYAFNEKNGQVGNTPGASVAPPEPQPQPAPLATTQAPAQTPAASAPSSAQPPSTETGGKKRANPLKVTTELRAAQKLCRMSDLYTLVLMKGYDELSREKGINLNEAMVLVEFEADKRIRELMSSENDVAQYCFKRRMEEAGGKLPFSTR